MPNLRAINHGNQKKRFEFLSLNQKGKVKKKKKKRERNRTSKKSSLEEKRLMGFKKARKGKCRAKMARERRKAKLFKELGLGN